MCIRYRYAYIPNTNNTYICAKELVLVWSLGFGREMKGRKVKEMRWEINKVFKRESKVELELGMGNNGLGSIIAIYIVLHSTPLLRPLLSSTFLSRVLPFIFFPKLFFHMMMTVIFIFINIKLTRKHMLLIRPHICVYTVQF